MRIHFIIRCAQSFQNRPSASPTDSSAYQQRELDRVAQTIVTSIAAVERIDSAALLEIDA